MGTNLNKYFAGELTSEEKEVFLLNVKNNGEMREEFIEYQSVVALVDWSFPKDDKELEIGRASCRERVFCLV